MLAGLIYTHHISIEYDSARKLYSFYHSAEGRRPSRPRHRSKGARPEPKAVSQCFFLSVLEFDPSPQSCMLSLDNCDLRYVSVIYTVFQKSDAKIQITITMTHLIRINYPLSSFNYRLSGTNVANFNKIHHIVSEQQL